MIEFLKDLGLRKNQHIILHGSFKKIISVFPNTNPIELISKIQQLITKKGSLIMPAFTYSFKSKNNDAEIFDRNKTPVKVGTIAEVFRKSEKVIRTSSPTHSFSIWGKITNEISSNNSPGSPLGDGSVLDGLTEQENAFALLLGTNFESLSFCHYLEIKASVPWYNYFPWDYLGKESTGVSVTGEQILKEVPGCSKPFINFESYLLDKKLIKPKACNELVCYYIPINLLLEFGISFFKENPEKLLCPKGNCNACDVRRNQFLK
jgi:aminoglycoside 3-N-acetyltransferase